MDRDIPMPLVTSGVEYGNLRELCLARMRDLGTKCRDVRTREVRGREGGELRESGRNTRHPPQGQTRPSRVGQKRLHGERRLGDLLGLRGWVQFELED